MQMGYRKKNSSIVEIVINSSWKFSAIVAVLILLISYALLPLIFSSSKILQPAIPSLQSLSNLIAGIFAILAVFKLGVNLIRNDEQKSQSEELEKFIAAKKLSQRPYVNRKEFNNRIEPTINKSSLEGVLTTQQINSLNTYEQKEIPVQERWTLEFINSIEWKRFEELCSYYFDEIGVKNQQTSLGADGGIDLILFEYEPNQPSKIVQCKKWSNPVGLKLMREFLGVMHHKKISKGIYFTTDFFNKEAILFAHENNIELVDGRAFVSKIKNLTLDAQKRIYDKITTGDFTTPTCVRCGLKMVLKTSDGKQFWGCSRYPKCRVTINIKSQPKRTSSKNNLLY
jgi:restriction system protein